MVLLSLGILVASFTFLVYRIPPSEWPHLFVSWRLKPLPRNGSQDRPRNDEIVAHEEKRPARSQAVGPLDELSSNRSRLSESSSSNAQDSKEGMVPVKPQANALKADRDAQLPHFRLESSQSSSTESMSSQTNPQPTISINSKPSSEKTHSTMLPPPLPSKTHRPSSLLIPPPKSASALRPLPKNPNILNPPPSAASTLRTPPSRSSNASSRLLPASTSTLPPPSRPSKKVLLTPGHSPLDWAHLTSHPPTPTFLRGSELPPQLIRVPPSMLTYHNGKKGRDAWGTWQGRVYNLTPYLKFHPGGEGELLRAAGKAGVGEKLFLEVHPWVNWEGILGECLVGVLVGEGEGKEEERSLEDMD